MSDGSEGNGEFRYPAGHHHAGLTKAEAAEVNRRENYHLRTVEYPDGTVESGRDAELRVSRLGLRLAWQARAEELMEEGYKSGAAITLNEARLRAFQDFPPGCQSAADEESERDARFTQVVLGALRGRTGLRNRASIDRDLEWIAANYVVDDPRVSTAPSRLALVWALECRRDAAIRKQFWSYYQAKCMSPGEPLRKRAKKEVVFKEDGDADEAVTEEDLRSEQRRILFGDGAEG